MADVMSSFSPVESSQSENQFKENLKTSNKTKEAKKESKRDLASCYFLLHVLFFLHVLFSPARVYEAQGP